MNNKEKLKTLFYLIITIFGCCVSGYGMLYFIDNNISPRYDLLFSIILIVVGIYAAVNAFKQSNKI